MMSGHVIWRVIRTADRCVRVNTVDSRPRQIGNFDAWRAAGTGHRIKYWLGGRTSAAVDCRRQVLVCVRVPPQSVCLLLARWYRVVPNHPYPSEGSHRLYGKENISSFTARISFSRERSLPSPSFSAEFISNAFYNRRLCYIRTFIKNRAFIPLNRKRAGFLWNTLHPWECA